MDRYRVEIVCDIFERDRHDRPRVVDSFMYAEGVDDDYQPTGRFRWVWDNGAKTGGGKLTRDGSGLREWFEPAPSHNTVREDFDDGVARVELRCPGHGHAGLTWHELVTKFLDPCRANGIHRVPLSTIVSIRTSPTTRRRADTPDS